MSKIVLDLINVHQVTRIYVVDEEKSKEYQPYGIVKRPNFWGVTIGYDRFFWGAYLNRLTFAEALERFNIKKGEIYYRPYVAYVLSSGEKITEQFKTLDEALSYARQLEIKTGVKFEELSPQ